MNDFGYGLAKGTTLEKLTCSICGKKSKYWSGCEEEAKVCPQKYSKESAPINDLDAQKESMRDLQVQTRRRVSAPRND